MLMQAQREAYFTADIYSQPGIRRSNRLRLLYAQERPSTHCTGGGKQSGWARKISLPQGFNPQTASPHRAASTQHEQSQMINETNDSSQVTSHFFQMYLKKVVFGLDSRSSG